MFGDGKAAMDLMGQWLLGMQGPNSTSGKGLPQEDIGILSFPIVPGGKGNATDTLGGINGWLVSKSAPPEAVDFLKFFSQEKYAKEAAASAAYIPVVKGAEASFTDPLFKRLASDLAATTYHQNYFDQDLGPSVGRVINDVSVSVAAGEMTPEAAAAAIQDAAEQRSRDAPTGRNRRPRRSRRGCQSLQRRGSRLSAAGISAAETSSSNPPAACPRTAGRRSSCSCRRRCFSSPFLSHCRWRRRGGTASTTGTDTVGPSNSSD